MLMQGQLSSLNAKKSEKHPVEARELSLVRKRSIKDPSIFPRKSRLNSLSLVDRLRLSTVEPLSAMKLSKKAGCLES
jgi:hypothetical protein